jgi:hypothetical protein
VFDRSCVHRGKNIEASQRVALTNYYLPDTPERWQRSQERWGQYMVRPLISSAQTTPGNFRTALAHAGDDT